ncbi:MAG TPA: PQQ-dependent catabolism-associated CXXCW motif protein [Aliidongia sp.]|nr:PQQ-dependent catabolism-associated CXXCW motif protein [Aliidongia sp.]
MRAAAAICAALLLAASGARASGVPEPEGYRLDDYRAPVPDGVAGAKVLRTETVKAMLDQGGVVLIDVLPAPRRPEGMKPDQPWMPVPRRDLPGSLWLPDVGRGAISSDLDRWFQDGLARATGGDKDKPIIFYCLADCWMSWNATKRAVGYGYRNVAWYPDGTDGWAAAGLPLVVATPASETGK